MKFFLTLILFFSISGKPLFCQSITENVADTLYEVKSNFVLNGHFLNEEDNNISLSYVQDFISLKVMERELPVIKNKFGWNCSIDNPQIATIKLGSQKIAVYMEPNQLLSLDIHHEKNILFEGDLGDENMMLNALYSKFNSWNAQNILYEIEVSTPILFKEKLNNIRRQKLKFIKNYTKEFDLSLSKNFVNFIRAEIDYWWAYHLLQYRHEKLIKKSPDFDLIKPSFYDFLNLIEISNDDAFLSPYYVNFLELYLNFRRETKFTFDDFKSKDILYSNKNSINLLTKPLVGKLVTKVQPHSILKYLNRSYPKNIDAQENQWLYVETETGDKGYAFADDLKTYAPSEKIESKQWYTPTVAKVDFFVQTRSNETPIFEDAYLASDGPKYILPKDVQLKYLQLKTSEPVTFKHKNVITKDYLLKVEIHNGEYGWIPKHLVSLKERTIKTSGTTQFLSPLTNTTDADKYLKNKALYYTLAKSLYWSAKEKKLEALQIEIADFKAENPYTDLKKLIRAAIDVVQLNKLGGDKETIASYEYSSIKNLFIRGEKRNTSPNSTHASSQLLMDVTESDIIDLSDTKKVRPFQETAIVLKDNSVGELVVHGELIFKRNTIFNLNTFEKKTNGELIKTISLSDPVFANLKSDNQQQLIYLSPGQKLTISNNNHTFSFEGYYKNENDFLFKYQKLPKFVYAKNNSALENFNLIKQNLQKEERFLTSFKSKLDVSFYKTILSEIKAKHLSLFIKTLEAISSSNLAASKTMKEKIEQEVLHQIKLVSPLIVGLEYASFLTSFEKYFSNKLNKEYQRSNYFEGKPLAFLETKSFAIACKQGQAKTKSLDIKNHLIQSPYEDYNDLLRTVYTEEVGLLAGADAPNFKLFDINKKPIELANLKGKVVYLDFWATWCMPCLRSLAHAKKLVKEYENQDIAFVFISLDEDKSLWEPFVFQQNLPGVQVHGSSKNVGFSSEIAQLYKVKNLPTYYLINKAGKIAFKKTYSPSSPMLRTQIEALLSNEY